MTQAWTPGPLPPFVTGWYHNVVKILICFTQYLIVPPPHPSLLRYSVDTAGDEHANDESVLLQLPCGGRSAAQCINAGGDGREEPRAHVFHQRCILMWLRRSCRCPLCKADVRPALKGRAKR